jgi:hypothetical protein
MIKGKNYFEDVGEIILIKMDPKNTKLLSECIRLNISLIQKKSDTTQFLWVTIGPTYKLTTGKLSVQYALLPT